MSFSDGMGLNWLVLVVIPESDFRGEIDTNHRHILVICAIATIMAILSSILTTRWLMRSISALIQSSQKIRSGNLTDPVLMLKRSSWEVMNLSQSLEQMRQGLFTMSEPLSRVSMRSNRRRIRQRTLCRRFGFMKLRRTRAHLCG